jgi:hypothetical protein
MPGVQVADLKMFSCFACFFLVEGLEEEAMNIISSSSSQIRNGPKP